MALIWIDGFEGYTTVGSLSDALVARRYAYTTGLNLATIVAGRLSAYAIRLGSTGAIATPSLTTDDTLIIGASIYIGSMSTVFGPTIALYDGGTLGISLRLTTGGGVAVYKDTTLLATSSNILGVNRWYFLELKVTCAVSGMYEVRLNGQSILSDSGLDTKAGAHDYYDIVRLSTHISSSTSITIDDLYICDSTGSNNNDFLGPCRVAVLNPTSDSAVNWSTVYPALTDHYADVDDGAAADDTTYVEDATTGHRDLFEYEDLATLTSINGISINTTCRVTDVTPIDLKTVAQSNSTDDTFTPQSISSTSYVTVAQISVLDPNTNDVWVVSDLNSALFGFEVG